MARNDKGSRTVARYEPMDCVLVRAPALPIQSCPYLTAVDASEAVDPTCWPQPTRGSGRLGHW